MNTSAGDKAAKIFVIGLITIITAFLIYAYFYLLKWNEEEVDMGPTREAGKNPFLAAEMYLNRQNMETEVTRNFSLFDKLELDGEQVGDQDTIIVIDGRGAIKENRFDKLSQWIEQGGTLVTSTANPFIGFSAGDDPILDALGLEVTETEEIETEAIGTDEIEEEKSASDENLSEEDSKEDEPEAEADMLAEIFKAINPDACDAVATPTRIEFDGEDGALEADFYSRNSILFYDEEPTAWVSNTDGVALTYHEFGNGYIYVTVDNQIWRNNRIHCFDHAYVLWQLVNPNGKVWFVINQDAPSLTAMIWTASPVAVTGALLTLLLWLWRSGIRLGPVYHPRRIERRNFAEHIHANAVFLWRHHQQQTLLDQLKKDIAVKVTRRIRDFDQLPESEQLTHLEQLTGFDRTDIYQAYFRPLEKSRQQFLFACKTLKQVKDKL